MKVSKRQKEILSMIVKGSFAICHLYDRFRLKWATLERHVRHLESLGLVEVWMDRETHSVPTMNFSATREGREFVTPIKLGA